MLRVAALGALLAAAPPLAAGGAAPRPVVIVDDARQIRRAVEGPVDGTFTPSQDEAEAPRRELPRYLDCGGYARAKEKYLFCSFVTGWPKAAERKEFPMIDDGGASVCRCTFKMKTGKIVKLEWNGEA